VWQSGRGVIQSCVAASASPVRYTTTMEVKAKKTARFDALVKEAGQPVQVTLWTKPEDDQDFMRAVKEKRVATVIQNNVGTKKDYGLVGFYPQDRATYLLFPKPIDLPEETKIVGIKYDRLAAPEPKGAIYRPPKPTPPKAPMREKARPQPRTEPEPPKAKEPPKPPKPEPPPPRKLFTFHSKVELTAKQTATIEVEATSAKEAGKLLKARAEELAIDPAQAKLTRKVARPQKRQ